MAETLALNTTLTKAEQYRQLLPQVLADLYAQNIQSVLVEGGPTVLNALLGAGLWDEIRVFRSPMRLGQGIAAPRLGHTGRRSVENVGPDELLWYVNDK